MIEVEKKFQPTVEQLNALLQGARSDGFKEHTDCYYDTSDFYFTKNGCRLRKRNNTWELKLKKQNPKNPENSYSEEIEDVHTILSYLNFPVDADLDVMVSEHMEELCVIKTKRFKYYKKGFIIDVDETNFGHTVCEIELKVKDEKKINKAEQKIIKFAQVYGLDVKTKIPGKVAECLRITRPDVYEKYVKMKEEIRGKKIDFKLH
ncbi:MAG: CYTH domain-containing protein [Candidatus Paceibacterota bacterium]